MNVSTKMFFQLLGVLALSLILPLQSFADCNCPTTPSLKASLDGASVVFVGRVEELGSTPLKPGFSEIQVTVLKRFKNDDELRRDLMILYTPESGDDCGISFQPGFEYLIFATGNPAFYQTTQCERTEVLENAQIDVRRLDKLTN